MSTQSDRWFAVRCVFEVDRSLGSRAVTPSPHLYEERITLWRASSFTSALSDAVAEARNYCEDDDTTYLGLAQAYELYDEPGHGLEVFSLMRGSNLAPDDYVSRHFATGLERIGDEGA
jgi:hypothetical protein